MFEAGMLILLVGVIIADSQIIQIPMLLLLIGASLVLLGARHHEFKK